MAGKTLPSQLDSPASPDRIDAQASLSPGQSVNILYESANPSRIRLANSPAEVTLAGSIKAALLFLIPGLLLAFASRPRRGQQLSGARLLCRQLSINRDSSHDCVNERYGLIATIETPASVDCDLRVVAGVPINEGDCFRRQAVAFPALVLASPWPERH